MRTQQELMQAYWGPGGTVDMVKEYNDKHGCDVEPWECVKFPGMRSMNDHPGFNDSDYTLALTILYDDKRKEHRPVFVGDRLYVKGHVNSTHLVGQFDALFIDFEKDYQWNQPKPKRTFKLGDMELPCPLKTEPCADNLNYATLCNNGQEFYFESCEAKMQWRKAFNALLTAARDKE